LLGPAGLTYCNSVFPFADIPSLTCNNDRLDPVMQIIAFEIEENELDKD
jgi:hypothetical protein